MRLPRTNIYRLATTLALILPLAALVGLSWFPPERDADVIVVGAGIAGLSAALEASANGARVVVIEANSVAGGHAVRAGGLSMVNTSLQQSQGIKDSPNLAVRDYFRWGEDADRFWVRQYAEKSAPEVYDWLTDLGVRFRVILPTPEDSVPRFHFTRGSAVNVVMPMLRKAMFDPNISFIWNTRATALARAKGRIIGVFTINERDGEKREWRAASTVLTTGGFQNNLQMVRMNWPATNPVPQRLFQGAGHFATGDGYRMAAWAGADMQRMDRQVIFYGGVPDPADQSRQRALYVTNPAAVWVGSNGRRFIDESADSKVIESVVGQLDPVGYWMIFDSRGARKLNVRDALPAERQATRDNILANPAIAKQADNIETLARITGLSIHGLQTTIETWNRMVEVGTDFQFDRFNPASKTPASQLIVTPPFYALRIFPMTRKNMGGPAIDVDARVVTAEKLPIPGLYAAGELTGVAGINGSYGGNGTFLGPSVLTGRIAGKTAASDSKAVTAAELYRPFPEIPVSPPTSAPDFGKPGYWHYDAVHRLVAEQAYTCDRCHANANTSRPNDNTEMIARLRTCAGCH